MFKSIVRQGQIFYRKAACITDMQVRNTTIVRRVNPPKWREMRPQYFRPPLEKDETLLVIEEETQDKEHEEFMQVILTRDIEGFGIQGEHMTVSKFVARTKLFPANIAVYPTEENKKKYLEIRKQREKEKRQTITGQKTLRQLIGATVSIPMSADHPWTLNKSHIRIACRQAGIIVKESAIKLPQEEITQPCEFVFKIRVNDLDTVELKGHIYFHNKDPDIVPDLPEIWKDNEISLDEAIEKSLHS